MIKQIMFYLCFLNIASFAQDTFPDKFILTPYGVDPIMIQLDSLNSSDIYKRSLKWVQKSYKNPNNINSIRENEQIRIDGIKERAWHSTNLVKNIYHDV